MSKEPSKGVNIAGYGIVSSLGMGKSANCEALCAMRSGVSRWKGSTSADEALGVPVGRLAKTNDELRSITGSSKLSRTALLAIAAAREAVEDAGLSQEDLSSALLISATTVGGMDVTPAFYAPFSQDNTSGMLRDVVEHSCSSHCDAVAHELGIGGWRTTVSTACSSGANAIMLGARLIESGMAKVVICGGTDSLCDFTMGGFNSLMILSHEACHPLSEGRDGLNLGEGAAYFVLTAEGVSPKSQGKVVGWHNANDSHHQTAMTAEGRGAQLAMRGAMEKAGIKPCEVGYLNLHGTATPNNDASETAAMRAIWDSEFPAYGSTKGYTGHTLAAAGAIEAAFCLMALSERKLWPNIGLTQPISTLESLPVTEVRDADIDYAMSNSLGFGGNCTSLIFKKA